MASSLISGGNVTYSSEPALNQAQYALERVSKTKLDEYAILFLFSIHFFIRVVLTLLMVMKKKLLISFTYLYAIYLSTVS